jgi:hypothetical protein
VDIVADSASSGRGRIFISYRREETAYAAGWLFDRLAEEYGAGQIFKDVGSIEPGDDFGEMITMAVGSSDLMLALISDRWLTATEKNGQRHLDDPNDFVRLQIEAALQRNVRIIPILVEGASMPRADELPASWLREARPNTSMPSTNRASGAWPRGTITRPNPAEVAASVAGSTPRTGRTRPSSPSSPSSTVPANSAAPSTPSAASTAATIAKSKCSKCLT